jgi:sterol desaturase/sphingolipid hydroxylase (fatty acid hydroxylase superfamily)
VVSVPAGAAFFALFLLVPGAPAAYAVAAGFYAGYVAYDMVHFALHHARPRNRFGRFLHQLHMRHHFEDDTCGFGVSAPWWDTVFGTATSRRKPSTR